jgi:adenosylhomocysteine nucleosidase
MRDHDRNSKFRIPHSKFRVGVVFALAAEFSPWRRRHAFRRVNTPRGQTFEAEIGAAHVRAVIGGVGAPDTRRLQETLFAPPVDAVIVAGAAGGLKPQYRCGEVVGASRVKTPGSSRVVAADSRMLALASHCGATIVDSFVTVDRMVLHAGEKATLSREADAVDMESFAVVREAADQGIPAVAVRVIADTATEDLPLDLSAAIRADGRISVPRAIAGILSRPARWRRVVRAGLSYRCALAELAAFLDRFVAGL